MHRNSNITDNLNSTFLAAGIFDFGHLQHIDFQRLFSCKNALTFTGKEKDSETGFYYFGARYYDPSLSGLFLSVDPMADKYPSTSPYAYCAWNPVKLVDPDGREIDPSCLEEWDNQKAEIENKRDELLVYSLLHKSTGGRMFSQQAKKYNELNSIVTIMEDMEESEQMYKLIPKTQESNAGGTYLQGDVINVEYSSTALLVHEIAHCGQFEKGEIGFSTTKRGGFTDYWDELSAYQAQAAFDATSIPRNQYPALTIEWLKSIQKPDGSFPYRDIGAVRYGGDSDCSRLNQAFPNANFDWTGVLSSQHGTYFKSTKQ